jgi:hypothetical protein
VCTLCIIFMLCGACVKVRRLAVQFTIHCMTYAGQCQLPDTGILTRLWTGQVRVSFQ